MDYLQNSSSFRIALAQFNPVVGDFSGNKEKIRFFIQKAREQGAQLLCFPELSLCGYPPEDLLYKPAFLQQNQQALNELAKECPDIAVILRAPYIE